MKTIVAILFLFATVKAHYWQQQQNPYTPLQVPPFQSNPGHGYGRRNNPFYQHNWHQPHHSQNDFYGSSVSSADWICRSPKTGDMMIITSDDDSSEGSSSSGQQWQPYPYPYPQNHPRYPSGETEQNSGSTWNPNQRPNEAGEHIPNSDKVNIHVTPSTTNNPDSKIPTEPHGGEGLIDIRMGE